MTFILYSNYCGSSADGYRTLHLTGPCHAAAAGRWYWWVAQKSTKGPPRRQRQKSKRNCFFGTLFALINVKVMHFIRFVRVQFTQRALIIIIIIFAGTGTHSSVEVPSARCDLVLWTVLGLPSCRVFTFFCDLIDVHNVICSHQAAAAAGE